MRVRVGPAFGRLSVIAILAGGPSVVGAQDAQLRLQQAVTQATDRYPSVRAAAAQVSAASANAALARDAYLPRADVLWQINRSTRNNVSGLLFPQGVISPISGPVTPESGDAIWNHAAGVLVAWEPLDFGYRAGMVRAADAGRQAAGADEALTRLQVATVIVRGSDEIRDGAAITSRHAAASGG